MHTVCDCPMHMCAHVAGACVCLVAVHACVCMSACMYVLDQRYCIKTDRYTVSPS